MPKEIDVRIALAEKLHRPPLPADPPLNFRVHIFNSKKRGCGMLTLPTQEVGDTFLRTYGHTSIMVKGRKIMSRLSDKPVNEGRVRHIRSIPWEDPNALEERNRQKAADSQPIELQGYAFGHVCRDGSFLVDCDTLGSGDIACDLDRRQIRLTVRQGTSDVPVMVDDLNSAMSSLFSATQSASYMPPQIKTVIATDPSDTILGHSRF
jgi:RNA-dependent RNA polymerase